MIAINNQEGKLLEQTSKPTNEFLEFPVAYNEAPKEWSVTATSNEITSEANFNIKEKKEIKIELINTTIILTNAGNIPYNDTILIEIGNTTENINAFLQVNETQRYTLNAFTGEYLVSFIADGKEQVYRNVMLTGNAISIKEASGNVLTLVRYPIVWIFIIGIMGFISFMFFKKGYKRSFFGRRAKKEKNAIHHQENTPKGANEAKEKIEENTIVNPRTKAELSLSLKGDKQPVEKITKAAEESKAFTYENHDHLLFIFAPIKTRTFKNEKSAIELAQKIKSILLKDNKLFKQKIEFGLSIHSGDIIAKQKKDILEFMSFGTLITTAKKISNLSNEEILLSKEMKEKATADVKTEKLEKNKTEVYAITSMKNSKQHEKFLTDFVGRLNKK
jgi:hypothetical protein